MQAIILILTLVLCFSSRLFAQHTHGTHEPGQKKAIALDSGLGNVNHPVTTKSVEAQKFFDQGLAYLYAFNHAEAIRSFRHAAELDPEMAMAYWGIALGLGSNYNVSADESQLTEAYSILQKANALAHNVSPAERDYIAALSKRYAADPKADRQNLANNYKAAMGDVVKKYPDDLDAATLYAESMMNLRPWQLWSLDGKPAEGTLEIVAVLESVLKRNPNHSGANHYYIHAIEASPNPERGLPSASRLHLLAPKAGHLVHMPSHIYLRTGDFDAAAEVNDLAIVADRDYIQKSGASGVYPLMYYNHNIHMLAASHARNGNYAGAIKAARELEANVAPNVKAMPMLEMFMPYHLITLIRFQKWDDIAKYPQPAPELKITNAVWRTARGLAFLETGKPAESEKELILLREIVSTIPADAGLGNSSAHGVLKIADNLLAGQIAIGRDQMALGITLLRESAAAEDRINYNEPPDWDLPVREWLGRALLRNGDYAGAEQVYRAELDRNPRSGRSLFGLAEALRKQGNTRSAQLVDLEFEKSWINADTKLNAAYLYGKRPENDVKAATEEWKSKTIRLRTGVTMNYAEQGDSAGPVMILLHGLTDSWSSYSSVMRLLDPKYHVFALDHRGHGDSSRPETGYAMNDLAKDVIAFMDAKNIRKATIVGHSMGSFVAMKTAAAVPERVIRLVLIGTGPKIDDGVARELKTQFRTLKDPVPESFAREFQASSVYAPLPDGFLDNMVRQSRKVPARIWNAALDGAINVDLSRDFGKINMPVLIIWGDKEQIFSRSQQDTLLTKLPNAKLKVIPGAGHSPNWEYPDVVTAEITEFIGRSGTDGMARSDR